METIRQRFCAPTRRTRGPLLWVLAAAVYLASIELSDWWTPASMHETILWLPSGVGYALVLAGGYRFAAPIAAVVLLESAVKGVGPVPCLLFAGGAAASAVTMGALTRIVRPDPGESVTDTFVRFAATTVGVAIGSSFTLAALVAGGSMPEPDRWLDIFLAQVAGAMVAGPCLYAWLRPRSTGVASHRETLAMLATTAALAATVSISVGLGGLHGGVGASYLLFPPVLWAALRTGRRGVTTAVLLIAVIAAANLTYGRGPFATSTAVDTIALEAFLIVMSLTALLLAALESARRASESTLRSSEQRFRALIEKATDLVSVLTPDGVVLYESPSSAAILGVEAEEIVGSDLFSRIHPSDVEQARAAFERMFAGQEAVEIPVRARHADGHWVELVAIGRNLLDDPAVGGIVVNSRDVSGARQAERLQEQLQHVQRLEAIGLLAGGVAHDFNNLLTVISGYTELALAHAAEPESWRRDLEEVRHASDRAADLTSQLLAFGRRQTLEQRIVDLNVIVEETHQLLVRLLGENIAVELRLDPELGAVRCDPGQLAQVLVNLAVNGRDAMPGGGLLTIATENLTTTWADDGVPSGDYAVITVADTGHGIPAEACERLFEPFFTTKEVGKGTGLGLAMVHGIVEQMGGRVTVRSEPGQGAEFRVMLPRSVETPWRQEPERPARPGGSETVLLVEDEALVRGLTAEMLERQGYGVIAAATPEEALAVESPWELLLSDIVMPGMSGPELAERLLERHPGAGVLFTSGYSDDAIADRSALPGALLEKPFTLDQLAAKVREALDAVVAVS